MRVRVSQFVVRPDAVLVGAFRVNAFGEQGQPFLKRFLPFARMQTLCQINWSQSFKRRGLALCAYELWGEPVSSARYLFRKKAGAGSFAWPAIVTFNHDPLAQGPLQGDVVTCQVQELVLPVQLQNDKYVETDLTAPGSLLGFADADGLRDPQDPLIRVLSGSLRGDLRAEPSAPSSFFRVAVVANEDVDFGRLADGVQV